MNEAMRKQLTDCVRARLDTIDIKWSTCGAEVKMLDYACGNGFFSRVSTSLYPTGLGATAD